MTMTLEQVRDFLRAEYDMRMAQARIKDIANTNDFLRASETISNHLAPRDVMVSDEDVERLLVELHDYANTSDDCCYGTLATSLVRDYVARIRIAITSAASLPVAKVEVSGWDAIQSMEFFVREGLDVHPENIEGWLDDLREATLSQGHGGGRGWKLVPVEPTHEMCGAPDAVWHPEARKIYQQMLAASPAYDDGGNGNG